MSPSNQFCRFLVKILHCAELGPTCHMHLISAEIAAATLLLKESTVQIQTAAHLRHSRADAHTRYAPVQVYQSLCRSRKHGLMYS